MTWFKFSQTTQVVTPPRGGLDPNRGFVELGAFRTKRLRRLPEIEMFKWNSISDQIRAESESAIPKRDRMRLARHLGVSRARITQVLRRLKSHKDDVA